MDGGVARTDFTTEVTENTEVNLRAAGSSNAEVAEGAEETQLLLSRDSSAYSATSAFHLSSLLLHLSSVHSVSSVVKPQRALVAGVYRRARAGSCPSANEW